MTLLSWLVGSLVLAASPLLVQSPAPGPAGQVVVPPDHFLREGPSTPGPDVGRAERIAVTGVPFGQAWRVVINRDTPDTNAVQFTVPIPVALQRGDGMVLEGWVRGPGTIAMAVQKGTSPWTTSMFEGVSALPDGTWRRVTLPFTMADNHPAGDAVIFVRAAFGAQAVEIGGVSLRKLGQGWDIDRIYAALEPELGTRDVTVTVDPRQRRQRMDGLGANMANGRGPYGDVHDSVSRWLLPTLKPNVVRLGIPLNSWSPEMGRTNPNDPRLKQVLELAKEAQGQGAKLIATVWHGPGWLATEPSADIHTWRKDRYDAGVEVWTSFLKHAKDAYGVTFDYVSFNEADYGVNVKWDPADLAEFMRRSTPAFRRAGLKSRWLVADTANGRAAPPFIRAAFAVPSLRGELGPVSFHSWDVRGLDEKAWREMARLARERNLPVWCTELGWDAQAWRYQPPVWPTRANALNLAHAFVQSMAIAESSNLMYWQYQNDYPLGAGPGQPFPALDVVKHVARFTAPDGTAVSTKVTGTDLVAIAADRSRPSLMLVNMAGPARLRVTGLGTGPWSATEMGRLDAKPVRLTSLAAWTVPTRTAWIIEPDVR